MADARFEDAARPLRLRAETAEDVAVISALLQDAVATVGDAAWLPTRRRWALLLSRFRWEDAPAAARARRPFERVRATLLVEQVLAARTRGLDQCAQDAAFSVLALRWEEGASALRLLLAGGGDIALRVEAVEVTLTDVARPHRARALPRHD